MSFKIEDVEYEIASPCDQDWQDMRGGDQCRFCQLCQKNVYDFSQMTTPEIKQLLTKNESVCTKVYKRHDGTIITADCPVGLAQVKKYMREKKYHKAALAFMLLTFTTLNLACGNMRQNQVMGEIEVPSATEEIKEEVAPPNTRIQEIKKLKDKLKNSQEQVIKTQRKLMGKIVKKEI